MQLFLLHGAPLTYRGTQKQELDKVVQILMQMLQRTEQSSTSSTHLPVSSIPSENLQPVFIQPSSHIIINQPELNSTPSQQQIKEIIIDIPLSALQDTNNGIILHSHETNNNNNNNSPAPTPAIVLKEGINNNDHTEQEITFEEGKEKAPLIEERISDNYQQEVKLKEGGKGKKQERIEEGGMMRWMQRWIVGIVWSPFKWMWLKIKKLLYI